MKYYRYQPVNRSTKSVRKPVTKSNAKAKAKADVKGSFLAKIMIHAIIALVSPVALMFWVGLKMRGIYGLRK